MRSCKQDCEQGRGVCPTPQACELPEEDRPLDWVGIVLSGISVVMVVSVIFWAFVR